jgi:hypothetical protein
MTYAYIQPDEWKIVPDGIGGKNSNIEFFAL